MVRNAEPLSGIDKVMQKTKVAKRTKPEREPKARKKGAADHDLIALAEQSKAHDWLRLESEDIYAPEDGRPASWPKRATNAEA